MAVLDGKESREDLLGRTVAWLEGIPPEALAQLLYELVVGLYRDRGPTEEEFFRELNRRVERIIQY